MEPRHHQEVRERWPRTGDEPMHARSALRLRLVLAFIGLASGLAGIGIFGIWLHVLPLAILFGVLTVIALGNIAVVIHRIRQGAHFQPGPEVPPYRPDREERAPAEPRAPVSPARRRVRYLVMMGVCLLLLILAWTWVRSYSVPAAVIISVVAAAVPPIAAVVANADSPILREDSGRDDSEDERPDEDEDRDRRPPAPD